VSDHSPVSCNSEFYSHGEPSRLLNLITDFSACAYQVENLAPLDSFGRL
jgi:hypothetical protein